jgi:uncharacterized protein YdhG (YjbR/CyaY superfamily)
MVSTIAKPNKTQATRDIVNLSMEKILPDIEESGVSHGSMLYRSPWAKPFDYELLGRIIQLHITDKLNCPTCWRK